MNFQFPNMDSKSWLFQIQDTTFAFAVRSSVGEKAGTSGVFAVCASVVGDVGGISGWGGRSDVFDSSNSGAGDGDGDSGIPEGGCSGTDGDRDEEGIFGDGDRDGDSIVSGNGKEDGGSADKAGGGSDSNDGVGGGGGEGRGGGGSCDDSASGADGADSSDSCGAVCRKILCCNERESNVFLL